MVRIESFAEHRNERPNIQLMPFGNSFQMVVKRKKSFYEQLDTEHKVPPLLTVQVWDNDLLTRDDFLGTLNLNLAQLPAPASKPAKCGLPEPGSGSKGDERRFLNLFREGKVRGWYPIAGHGNGKLVQTVSGTGGNFVNLFMFIYCT